LRLVDIVGCVTPQASAARPKCRSFARASRSSSFSIKKHAFDKPSVAKNCAAYVALPAWPAGRQRIRSDRKLCRIVQEPAARGLTFSANKVQRVPYHQELETYKK
jgi:hypothetical protein